jgi:DNA invertase Pin-like site-specific DNA recombinase
LQKAIEACHLYGAALVVAKVDRLTRSVAFLHAILDAGIEVHFCDLPQLSGPTGRFMLNQMAAVAELEAGLISERTKAALAGAKARGTKLGNPQNLSNRVVGSRRGNAARTQQADQRAKRVLVEIEQIRKGGPRSLRELAEGLNMRGIPTPSRRGRKWNAVQVKRVLERSERGL